jgi:hypothetical protein
VDLRSLALVVLIFAASSALAGYVGMTYWRPVASQQMQPAAQPASPAPSPLSATAARPSSKPEASVVPPVPARETTQPQTLQSASEKKIPQDVQPAKNTMELSGSSAAAPRTIGSTETTALKCNKEACANAYRSFDAGDCTYQPANGPRRLCNKK